MKKIISSFCFWFLFISNSNSQTINDAGLWTTFNIQKDFKKNISVFLTEEFRLKSNFTRLNLFYTDIGVTVRPVKFLKISFAYRMIDKFLIDNSFSYRHRLMLDLALRKKMNVWVISYRHRLQSEIKNIYSSRNGSLLEWYSRHNFKLKCDLNSPIKPYVSAEYRYQIKDSRKAESNNLFHRQRYILGLDYKLNNRNTLGLYYLIQNEFNVLTPQNIYIIGLEYSITL
jgi:hypothetical protein